MTVVLLGLAGTALAVQGIRRGDDERNRLALAEQRRAVEQIVTSEIGRYSDALSDVAVAMSAQAELHASDFTVVTSPIDRARLPGATGISYVVPADTGQVASVQAWWRAHGAPDLRMKPVAGYQRHHLVALSRPLDSAAGTPGRDLAAAPAAVDALNLARDSRQVAASRPYRFLRDADLPLQRQQLSTLLAAPVYSASQQAPDRGHFRGWVVLGLRGGDFLRDSIGVVARDTVTVSLHDTTTDGDEVVLAAWTPPHASVQPGTARTTAIAAPQRTWQVQIAATDRLLPDTALHLQAVGWATGILITALLAGLAATVTTSRDRALRQVAEATAALREDITHREHVEEQLRQREKELVGFAGVIAHDLRSPLARISAYTDFLREEAAPSLNDEHRDFLDRLRSGTTGMQIMLDDLLDYATADNRPLTTAEVDLADIVTDIVTERTQTWTGEHRPTIVTGPLPVVIGDPTLLRQVFDNLIGNAIKYTHHGHTPHIEIATEDHPDDNVWRIEISDHGIGIPADQRDTVFTAFTRASGSQGYPGTGLGLAIVHRIIERHHGHIGVTGNDHGGSLFWITLPAAPATAGISGRPITGDHRG